MTSLLWQDSSCYVSIINKLNQSLVLSNQASPWGHWQIDPVALIMPNQTASLHLKYDLSLSGSEGKISYSLNNGTKFDLAFGNPGLRGDNYAKFNITSLNPDGYDYTVRCKSGGIEESCLGGSEWQYDRCPTNSGPVCVEYTIIAPLVGQFRCDFTLRNRVNWTLAFVDVTSSHGEWRDSNQLRDILPGQNLYPVIIDTSKSKGSGATLRFTDRQGTLITFNCDDPSSGSNKAYLNIDYSKPNTGYPSVYKGELKCVSNTCDTASGSDPCPSSGHPVCVEYIVSPADKTYFTTTVTIKNKSGLDLTLLPTKPGKFDVGQWEPSDLQSSKYGINDSESFTFRLIAAPISTGKVIFFNNQSTNTQFQFEFSNAPQNNYAGVFQTYNTHYFIDFTCSTPEETMNGNCPKNGAPLSVLYTIFPPLNSYMLIENASPSNLLYNSSNRNAGIWNPDSQHPGHPFKNSISNCTFALQQFVQDIGQGTDFSLTYNVINPLENINKRWWSTSLKFRVTNTGYNVAVEVLTLNTSEHGNMYYTSQKCRSTINDMWIDCDGYANIGTLYVLFTLSQRPLPRFFSKAEARIANSVYANDVDFKMFPILDEPHEYYNTFGWVYSSLTGQQKKNIVPPDRNTRSIVAFYKAFPYYCVDPKDGLSNLNLWVNRDDLVLVVSWLYKNSSYFPDTWTAKYSVRHLFTHNQDHFRADWTKKVSLNCPEKLTAGVSMNIITRIQNDQYFSKSQKSYIENAVKQVDNDVKLMFNNIYSKWEGSCSNLLEAIGEDDNIYKCNTLPEITDLKNLGSGTIPMYIQKLAHPDPLPLAVVPYYILQTNEKLLEYSANSNPLTVGIQEQCVHLVDLWLADNNVI